MRHTFRFSLEVIVLFVMLSFQLDAQWFSNTSDNNQIYAGFATQYRQTIASDGNGGAIIAWQDNRSADYDVYVQRINSGGSIQWTASGVIICSAIDNQEFPNIISDGAGGAIVVWEDDRNGSNIDIYAQRVDANGTALWTANGVAVCTSTNDQGAPTLVSDGNKGVIITWNDDRTPANAKDIYAQRIDSSGVVKWTANGVVICSAGYSQYSPFIVSDGSNGAIIVWEDRRSTTNYDIYSQRINTNGTVQWTANGVAICTESTDQTNPTIATDLFGGAIIAWEDSRNAGTTTDIYSQRIISTGTVSWTANGVAICTAANNQELPQIVTDGAVGVIIAWNDYRSGSEYDIYSQLIDASGALMWSINGESVCNQSTDQINPRLVPDGNGGAVYAWQDSRNGGRDIYAIKLNSGGGADWTSTGVLISNAGNNQEDPTLVSDGNGGAIITWEDFRNNSIIPDIYASKIDFDGALLPVELTSFTVATNMHGVHLEWNTATEINNYGFEIERRVAVNRSLIGNGSLAWTKIGFVEGGGTTNSPKSYSFNDNSTVGKILYRLKQIDRDGQFHYSQEIEINIGSTPVEFALMQNYPNPFNPSTVIGYQLPVTSRVSLKIYDAIGREVATLVNEVKEAGNYSATFDASLLSSGIYFARLQQSGNSRMMKINMIK